MNQKISCFKSLISIALAAQQIGSRFPLPNVVKNLLRLMLTKLVKNKAAIEGIEDWSTPLIVRQEQENAKVLDIIPISAEVFTTASKEIYPPDPVTLQSTNNQDATTGIRCLLVTSSLDVGGMDEVVVFLALGLPRHGIHVGVLHASINGTRDGIPSGRLGRLLLEQGVETVEMTYDNGIKWIEGWRPEVISAHDAPEWVLKAATNLGIPYIDTLHGMHSLFNADWVAESARGKQLAGIVAVSDLVREQYLHGNSSFSPDRIVTIPNGVDDKRRFRIDRNSARARFGIRDEYIFVSLGRLCLQKNTYGLVAGFAEVADRYPEAHLVLAGRVDDTVYFAQVQRLRESLACKARIHLRDHMSKPAELLAAADGFVLDSFFEGWSLASMEALYAGVPVVLSEVGGAREQIGSDEERGYLIPNPVGDPLRVNWETIRDARYVRQINRDALVEAMSSLVKNRTLWLDARERLISESAVRFHPDICLCRHAQVLSAVVNSEKLQHYTGMPDN